MEMINSVVNVPQVPDVAQIRATPSVPQDVAAASSSGQTKNQSSGDDASQGKDHGPLPDYLLRLTIDKDPDTGQWIYKAIDSATGKVVSQMPRETLQEMIRSESYQAGSVIDTGA